MTSLLLIIKFVLPTAGGFLGFCLWLLVKNESQELDEYSAKSISLSFLASPLVAALLITSFGFTGHFLAQWQGKVIESLLTSQESHLIQSERSHHEKQ